MRRRDENGQHWLTREDAANALREAVVKVRKGTWVEPSRQPLREYLATWLNGLRLAASTTASYRKRPARPPPTGRTSGCTFSPTSARCRWRV